MNGARVTLARPADTALFEVGHVVRLDRDLGVLHLGLPRTRWRRFLWRWGDRLQRWGRRLQGG